MAGYHFGCPHCRAKLEARDASRAGRTVTCPKCEQDLIIPPPPPMGVALSQTGGAAATPQGETAGQFVVSSDPGFKRGLSPAKAFGDASETAPAPSHSGFDKLPSTEPLQEGKAHVFEAGEEIEGYSFTVPEHDSEPAPAPAFTFKPKKKKSKVEEAPHPFEDPKVQLAALVGVVLLIIAISTVWSWLSGGGKEKDESQKKPSKAAAQEVPPIPTSPSVPQEARPGETGGVPGLPGAAPSPPETAKPVVPSLLPGSTEPASPPPAKPPAELPGAVPNVLPGAASDAPPGTAPRPLPESTPNVLPGAKP